jgi:phosphate:Na+ symporter
MVEFRARERRLTERHLERLRSGKPESIETSSLHLDVLRDLKRINSHLTSVAYPILEAAGELSESRLRAKKTVRARRAAKTNGAPETPPGEPQAAG